MTELVQSASRLLQEAVLDRVYPNRWRLLVLLLVVGLLAAGGEVREATVGAMADAFLAVTVFVAATLALVFWAERAFSFDLGVVMARAQRWQPAIAALLGALPGCGGAIVVVTQFVRGYASFGAFVSVLIATMGDAAFVLLAREPTTALLVFAISMAVGTVTGWIVDAVHGPDFMAVERDASGPDAIPVSLHEHSPRPNWLEVVWLAATGIGVVFGMLLAFQVDLDAYFGTLVPAWAPSAPVTWFGFAGAILSLVLWSTAEEGHSRIGADTMPTDPLAKRVVADTVFVTSWVVMAFLVYEIAVVTTGIDVDLLFGSVLWLTPLIGTLVGFIPGCGPQIVVTTLYLAGAVPFSAMMSNAIANDGDALFPAIALAPRAAVLATLYSGAPALLIGYALFFAGH